MHLGVVWVAENENEIEYISFVHLMECVRSIPLLLPQLVGILSLIENILSASCTEILQNSMKFPRQMKEKIKIE